MIKKQRAHLIYHKKAANRPPSADLSPVREKLFPSQENIFSQLGKKICAYKRAVN